jgi:hypothetical protein
MAGASALASPCHRDAFAHHHEIGPLTPACTHARAPMTGLGTVRQRSQPLNKKLEIPNFSGLHTRKKMVDLIFIV